MNDIITQDQTPLLQKLTGLSKGFKALCLTFLLLSVSIFAFGGNPADVKMIVVNEDGKPVIGAFVEDPVSGKSTKSNSRGEFLIHVTSEADLMIQADGYETAFVSVDKAESKVILTEVEKKVNLAFRRVDKKDLIGAVSVVDMEEEINKNYTTYGFDGIETLVSGYYGGIWGLGNMLILVDGVPRDLGVDLHTSEIDQITFLKGVGAVALYGSRAAKGVALITTKRGVAGDKRIDVRLNSGINLPIAYPEFLNAADYMTYYNQARVNDGLDPLYQQKEIDLYNSGNANPYLYPDLDYYSSDYLKKMSEQTDARIEMTAGNDRAKFYTTFGFLHRNSLLNFGDAVNDGYNRFNIRGNVDLRLNSFITATADVATLFAKSRDAHGDFWSQASSMRPNRIAPLIPIDMIRTDGDDPQAEANRILLRTANIIEGKYLLGGSVLNNTNAISDKYSAGYNEHNDRRFQFNAGLNVDLNTLLDGLSFDTKFAMDYANSYGQAVYNSYATYQPIWNSDSTMIESLTVYNKDARDGTQHLSGTWQENTIAFSGLFNYNKQLNNSHNLNAILLGTGYKRTTSGSYHGIGSANLGLHLGYNYLQKYYVDFDGALVHSAKLAKGNRQAFSPTVTLGWALNQEKFMQEADFLDYLKLTTSAGILNTDLDINNYYMYLGYYDNYSNSVRGTNLSLGFVKRKEISVGLSTSIFNRLLALDVNAYMNEISGFPAQVHTLYPNYMQNAGFLPYVNYGADFRKGIDFSLTMSKRIGEVDFSLGFVGIYQLSEALKRVENIDGINYDRLTAVGKSLETLWGLESEGLFQSQEDIDSHAFQTFGSVKPGDIKYKDQNGDGIIDNNDYVALGKWGSPFNYGLNFTAEWRNLAVYAQGFGSSEKEGFKDNPYNWVYGDRKYSPVVKDSWTEETKATATYPRLTTLSSDNNFRASDFWMYSSSRFILNKVQVSYDLSSLLNSTFFVKRLNVYLSGANLLYYSKEKEYERTSLGSPQTRFFNAGLKASF